MQSKFPRLVWLIASICFLLTAPSPLLAQRRQAKETVGIAPPQPVQLNVKIRREGKTEIPLRIHGVANEPLQFLIRTPPTSGRLTEPRQTGRESAVAVYEPTADLSVTSDRFLYAVKSMQGVSAAVEVAITILDQPPELDIPDVLEFATVRTGNTTSKFLEIVNAGGNVAVGEVIVDAPWRIEGKGGYRLGAGDVAIFKVFFAPSTGGKFEGVARFTSDPAHHTTLRGVGETSVVVNPSELILENLAGNPVRSGSLVLINQTDEPRELKLQGGERLQVPAQITLAAKGQASVPVQTAANDVKVLTGEILITAQDLELRIPVKGAPPGPVIQAAPSAIQFGRTAAGKPATAQFRLENIGGTPGEVTWTVAAPFKATQTSTLLLPGERRAFDIEIASEAGGRFRGWLQLKTGERTFDVALDAEVTGGKTSPAKTVARPSNAGASGRAGAPMTEPEQASPGESVPPVNLPRVVPEDWLADETLPPGVQVMDITPTTATIVWPASLSPATRYRVEFRQYAFDAAGELTVKWPVIDGLEITRQGQNYSTTIHELQPAQPWVIRVFPILDGGASTPRLFAVEFRTPQKVSFVPKVSALPGLLVVLGLLVAWRVVVYWRRRSEFGERMRANPTRRGGSS